MTRWAFGTNGLSNHRLLDAVHLLADLGYDGIAITLDTMHLDPYATNDVASVRRALDRRGLAAVVETGGRYVIDGARKHFPTLLDAPDAAEMRIDFLERAVRIGAELGADAVSFWSGTPPPATESDVLWERLTAGVERVVALATREGIRAGFEPEPGMFVDTISAWETLRERVDGPLGITLDLGHCHCLEDATIADCIDRVADSIVNVQVEDMRRGVHEHLEFGDGEIDFDPVFVALARNDYRGLVGVELPRFSHDGPGVARRSLDFLRPRGVGEVDS